MAEGPSIACPECTGRLTAHLAGNLRIQLCDACGAAWFGSGQLDSLVKHGPAALHELLGLEPSGAHAQHAEGAARCPLCNVALQPTIYPGTVPVHASACYQCGGILLDADSIQALDEATKQRVGSSSFGHQGGFGAVPPMVTAQDRTRAQFPSSPPQVNSIASSMYWNQSYYASDQAIRTQNTLIAVDIAADILSMFL